MGEHVWQGAWMPMRVRENFLKIDVHIAELKYLLKQKFVLILRKLIYLYQKRSTLDAQYCDQNKTEDVHSNGLFTITRG